MYHHRNFVNYRIESLYLDVCIYIYTRSFDF